MDINHASPKGTLYLSGFPSPAEWRREVLTEVTLLDTEWKLKLGPATADAATGRRQAHGALERMYRSLDRTLFGRKLRRAADLDVRLRLGEVAAEPGAFRLAYCEQIAVSEALLHNEPALYVEFEGRQMADLEEAVRVRLGAPEATLNAQVWMMDPAGRKRLLYQAQLDMDHRSLCHSIALCAAKLPALLQAALLRIDQPAMEVAPVRAVERPLGTLRQLGRLALAVGQRLLWRDQWEIEVYHSNGGNDARGTLSYTVKPPKTDFWADPFLLALRDRVWLLFEELPYSTNKGHISIVELDRDGKPIGTPQIVLSEPWHLAYPFVYRHEGKLYMLPDASSSRELRLYECEDEENPVKWNYCATLLAGPRIADATIAEHDGRLWMFCTQGDDDSSMDDTLHIYWADKLTGPWQPHTMNPVKIDARHSRPAGNMWSEGGLLHRVVQNCSTTYGYRTSCMRIVRLSEDDFEEELVREWGGGDIKPHLPWHTYNRHGNMFVLDRLRRVSRWASR
jgi:hypothetical protein